MIARTPLPAPGGVLFDLDGTLLDRRASLLAFLRWQARETLALAGDDEARFIARFVALDANGRVWKDKVYAALIAELNLRECSVGELLAVYELRFRDHCRAREGAIEAVETLHRDGFRLGLVSNGRSPFQERNFRALGLERRFDTVLVSAAVGLRKPDPAMFERARADLGTEPARTVFVGDDPVADMGGARAAGLRTIHLPLADNAPPCADAERRTAEAGQVPALVRELLGMPDRRCGTSRCA